MHYFVWLQAIFHKVVIPRLVHHVHGFSLVQARLFLSRSQNLVSKCKKAPTFENRHKFAGLYSCNWGSYSHKTSIAVKPSIQRIQPSEWNLTTKPVQEMQDLQNMWKNIFKTSPDHCHHVLCVIWHIYCLRTTKPLRFFHVLKGPQLRLLPAKSQQLLCWIWLCTQIVWFPGNKSCSSTFSPRLCVLDLQAAQSDLIRFCATTKPRHVDETAPNCCSPPMLPYWS